ncbi:MAG: hypothetical protein KA436_08650 [Oligoflexales bacterium]|nr:hypothetical protein [Oligoflexales bacterium]
MKSLICKLIVVLGIAFLTSSCVESCSGKKGQEASQAPAHEAPAPESADGGGAGVMENTELPAPAAEAPVPVPAPAPEAAPHAEGATPEAPPPPAE